MTRARVLIAEDFVLIQEMIRDLLEPECEVVAMVEDGHAALESAAVMAPDIVLLDASLPGIGGFEVAERLSRTYPDLRIIFLTAHAEPAYVRRAFELGAKGYVLKGSLRVELLSAIRAVLAGGLYRSAMLLKGP